MSDIKIVEFEGAPKIVGQCMLLVCPFRSYTTTVQEGMEVRQHVMYPECQYLMCPYYDEKGKSNTDRCLRALEGGR